MRFHSLVSSLNSQFLLHAMHLSPCIFMRMWVRSCFFLAGPKSVIDFHAALSLCLRRSRSLLGGIVVSFLSVPHFLLLDFFLSMELRRSRCDGHANQERKSVCLGSFFVLESASGLYAYAHARALAHILPVSSNSRLRRLLLLLVPSRPAPTLQTFRVGGFANQKRLQ